MHIYKFRMLSEENEDFIRDFEIQAVQTFEDFHKIINDSVVLKGNELASFYICDQKWNKQIEITLLDMRDDHKDDDDESEKENLETYVMNQAQIKDHINEPHQRLLYEYDFLDPKVFFIELLSVYKQKDDDPYPRCSLTRGNLTDPVVHEAFEEDDEELRSQLLEDFDAILGDRLDEESDFSENPPGKESDD